MFVNMRSNDVWMGFPYDVFAFNVIWQIMCDNLFLKPGVYIHNAASLHLYTRHENALVDIYDAEVPEYEELKWNTPMGWRYCTEAAQRAIDGKSDTSLIGSLVHDLIRLVRDEPCINPVFERFRNANP